MGAREREKERRPQPAGETVRERENARTGLWERERENARKSEMEKWDYVRPPKSEILKEYGRRYRENTVIRYGYLPIPSSCTVIRYRIGTGSIQYRTRTPL